MHTVHFPVDNIVSDGFIASAVGLFFSVNSPSRAFEPWEVKVVDDFFDSLEWTDTTSNPNVVSEVKYGDLMNMADMNNRWTYRGSVTTPPCAQNVYWNVLRTVYPLKQKHLD